MTLPARRDAHGFVDRIELQHLLAPVSVETFFEKYWQRTALHIKGSLRKVDQLVPGGFARADFYRALDAGATTRPRGYAVFAHQTMGFDRPTQHGGPIAPELVRKAFAAGSNISSFNLEDTRLMRLAARLKAQLGHPGEAGVAVTLSPPGFGWRVHFDTAEVFFVQCEGRKRMLISEEPHFMWPRGKVGFDTEGRVQTYDWDAEPWELVGDVDLSTLREIVLEPGDVFYCPPGVLHGTKAIDRTLTFLPNFESVSALDVIQGTLRRILNRSADWRHLPGVDPATSSGEMPARLRAFLDERLRELRRAVEALTPEALEYEWRKGTVIGAYGMGREVPPPPREVRPVTAADTFRVSRAAPMAQACTNGTDGRRQYHLFYGAVEIGVGEYWIPFMERLRGQAGEFRARDATRWAAGGRRYPWPLVRQQLALLCGNGVIERTDSTPAHTRRAPRSRVRRARGAR